jgi:hypothetical protein
MNNPNKYWHKIKQKKENRFIPVPTSIVTICSTRFPKFTLIIPDAYKIK